MAQQQLFNGESGYDFRTALNQMLTELYGNATNIPIKLSGVVGNTTQPIAANTFITQISITPVSGLVTLRIGVTPNGQEILGDYQITGFQTIQVEYLFTEAGNLYFTFTSGSGNLNIRIDLINNFN